MSAIFTQHAFERMREKGVAPHDIDSLLATIERVSADPGELSRSRDALRIGQRGGGDAFILRAGDIRAVVSVDPAKSDQVIVLSVYRADQDQPEADLSSSAPRRAEDFV